MTTLPTLPSTWTAPTSCFASTNYYYVLLGGGYFSNLYGTPTPVGTGNTPSGACFPPSFTINQRYITDGGCPSGYTRACATAGSYNGEPASTVTCCPSVTENVFSFMCRDHQYGCHATATAGVVWTGVVTDLGLDDPTEAPVTRKPGSAEGIEAWGIKFISVSPTSHSTATSTATADDTSSTSDQPSGDGEAEGSAAGSGRLSTGAIAGIAVGAVAVCVSILVAAFLLLRHKRKRQQVQVPVHQEPITMIPKQTEAYQLDAPEPPRHYGYPDPRYPDSDRRAWELPG
ncbi:hypothetical protein FAGAP_6665 [Fusarium agapanthi]|uniref:Mid2 domain-containing protein n=1 Tax=Fusarium agapanthi TaxID=1803897 RepID=A0A9P5B722_9HYPO|nr:hypothetical protein FAGAP_6665 [Fusarium agapanthi]